MMVHHYSSYCMLLLTFIGSEFTVSGFDRSHEVRRNYHWGEADITVVFPHQGPECKPMVTKKYSIDHSVQQTRTIKGSCA